MLQEPAAYRLETVRRLLQFLLNSEQLAKDQPGRGPELEREASLRGPDMESTLDELVLQTIRAHPHGVPFNNTHTFDVRPLQQVEYGRLFISKFLHSSYGRLTFFFCFSSLIISTIGILLFLSRRFGPAMNGVNCNLPALFGKACTFALLHCRCEHVSVWFDRLTPEEGVVR